MLLALPQGYKLYEVCKLVSWNTSGPPSSRSERGPANHHIDMTAGGGWILPTICLPQWPRAFKCMEFVWKLSWGSVTAKFLLWWGLKAGRGVLDRPGLTWNWLLVENPKNVRLSNETDFTQKGGWRLFLVLESAPLLIQASPTPYAMMKK